MAFSQNEPSKDPSGNCVVARIWAPRYVFERFLGRFSDPSRWVRVLDFLECLSYLGKSTLPVVAWKECRIHLFFEVPSTTRIIVSFQYLIRSIFLTSDTVSINMTIWEWLVVYQSRCSMTCINSQSTGCGETSFVLDASATHSPFDFRRLFIRYLSAPKNCRP